MNNFFTKQEKLFLLFLVFGLIVGFGIKIYKNYFSPVPAILSDSGQIQKSDSLFAKKAAEIDSIIKNSKTINKSKSKKKVVKKFKGKEKISININKSNADELIKIPHIGPVLAKRIIAYREQNGSFQKVEDLINIKGIGEKKLKSIKQFIYINVEQ